MTMISHKIGKGKGEQGILLVDSEEGYERFNISFVRRSVDV